MAQHVTRRNFLKGMGVVTIVVAGGVVWRAADSGVFSAGQGPAYEPWLNWREAGDPKWKISIEEALARFIEVVGVIAYAYLLFDWRREFPLAPQKTRA